MKGMLKQYGWSLSFSGILSAELVLLGDAVIVFCDASTPPVLACGLWVLLSLGLGSVLRWNRKWIGSLVCAIPLVLTVLLGMGMASWFSFSIDADYEFYDDGKKQLFGDRKVMVIVPHQDDELNILGGSIEEYVRYGSDVYPVFVTNGDYHGAATIRYQEALAVLQRIGVPKERVVFLGYGNDWAQDGPHIYNAAPGALVTSHAGRTETYGTEVHSVYRDGNAYTIENMTEDLKSLILEIHPDVIFCSDYDHHIDHKAVSLLFEKVMGQVLKENPDYVPIVYKAYAYSTAWEADADYYEDRVLSTKNPFEAPYFQQPAIYHWEDRIRFPVSGETLGRSLLGSQGYEILKMYRSQGAEIMAASVLNGDKVAWRRYTDSLCLRAEIAVSAGDAGYLNDFMLLENEDLRDGSRMPYDGVWAPSGEERTASVTLEKTSDVAVLALYDHPDPAKNVLGAMITFDDGTQLETGPLDPGGAVTWVVADQKNVSSFTVRLTETEGEGAGLAELEAYAQMPQADGRFLKLTDTEGNFLYDCLTAPDGTMDIAVYIHGNLPEWNGQNYSVKMEEGVGTVSLEGGSIRVNCPQGEKIILHVACDEAGVSDRIVIRNPNPIERLWDGLWRFAEGEVFSRYSALKFKELLIPATWTKISYVLRHL